MTPKERAIFLYEQYLKAYPDNAKELAINAINRTLNAGIGEEVDYSYFEEVKFELELL